MKKEHRQRNMCPLFKGPPLFAPALNWLESALKIQAISSQFKPVSNQIKPFSTPKILSTLS